MVEAEIEKIVETPRLYFNWSNDKDRLKEKRELYATLRDIIKQNTDDSPKLLEEMEKFKKERLHPFSKVERHRHYSSNPCCEQPLGKSQPIYQEFAKLMLIGLLYEDAARAIEEHLELKYGTRDELFMH